jgi:very-short-patch-repair endonuclease
MNGNEAAALALASEQYGVISRAQLKESGLTDGAVDQRLRARRLLVCHPGVYRVPGAPQTNRQKAMAACLWLGHRAAVSHVASGARLRLDGIRRPPLHVTTTVNRDAPFHLHRVRRLDGIDRVTVDGIPCTSATRTLIDCAGALDEEQLEIAFESARRMGLTSVPFLSKRFVELGGRGKPGSGAIRRLLEHQHVGDKPLESPLEVKVWRLVRRSGLPRPEGQVPILQYRVDLLWREQRVILECDGFEAHAGYLRWKRDRRRVSAIEAEGYRFVHATWDDVTNRSDEVIARTRHALHDRGNLMLSGK